jgi:transcription initiation factor TFIIB
MEAVISSTIYLACREEGYPRTMKEMCAVGTVTKKDLGKVFKTVPKNKSTKNNMWERCENNTRCPALFFLLKQLLSNKIMLKVN